MRNFFDVINKLISLAEDKDFKKGLESIQDSAAYTAPEALWEWRGREVSDLIYNGCFKEYANEEWFISLFMEFTEHTRDEVLTFINDIKNKKE